MRDNLLWLTQTVDNDREIYERVMSDLREDVGSAEEYRPDERAEQAAVVVYRHVCAALGVLPTNSSEWYAAPTSERENFRNSVIRNLLSSPADDTAGEWQEVGEHYLAKLDEELLADQS